MQDLRDILDMCTTGDVACMIAEPIQGVGGFATPPDGFFGAMGKVLDEHGILFIADEVQTGFGRTGDHFWGYQAHGIMPDLITIAKGIGNGVALGGVVGRADVIDCVPANSISTFGGNPLSCAGALATLDLLSHDLQGNACRRARCSRAALRASPTGTSGSPRCAARAYAGDRDCEPGTAGRPAARPGPRSRRADGGHPTRGLLVGKGGLFGNVLRIAPPLRHRGGDGGGARDPRAAAGGGASMTMLIVNGTVVGHRPARRRPTCSSTASDRRGGRARVHRVRRRPRRRCRDRHRRHGEVRRPRRRRRPHAHGAAVRRHVRLRHLRDRDPCAALGGTTTIIDFAVQRTGERVQDGLAAWLAKAEGQCAIDYAFHQIIGGVDDDSLKAMDELVAEGITSFKLFMAYPGVFYTDDGQILRVMQTAADNGSLIMMHAENGIAIDVLVAQALARGDTAPKYHGITRPWETEEEATHRAIMLAMIAGAPLYVVHMSAQAGGRHVAAARDQGWNVFGETCPQYLYLSLEEHLPPGLRRRQVRVLHAAAVRARGSPGRAVAVPAHRTTCRS